MEDKKEGVYIENINKNEENISNFRINNVQIRFKYSDIKNYIESLADINRIFIEEVISSYKNNYMIDLKKSILIDDKSDNISNLNTSSLYIPQKEILFKNNLIKKEIESNSRYETELSRIQSEFVIDNLKENNNIGNDDIYDLNSKKNLIHKKVLLIKEDLVSDSYFLTSEIRNLKAKIYNRRLSSEEEIINEVNKRYSNYNSITKKMNGMLKYIGDSNNFINDEDYYNKRLDNLMRRIKNLKSPYPITNSKELVIESSETIQIVSNLECKMNKNKEKSTKSKNRSMSLSSSLDIEVDILEEDHHTPNYGINKEISKKILNK